MKSLYTLEIAYVKWHKLNLRHRLSETYLLNYSIAIPQMWGKKYITYCKMYRRSSLGKTRQCLNATVVFWHACLKFPLKHPSTEGVGWCRGQAKDVIEHSRSVSVFINTGKYCRAFCFKQTYRCVKKNATVKIKTLTFSFLLSKYRRNLLN